MRDRGASAQALERLAKTLSVLPGWTHVPATVQAAEYGKRPALAPKALAETGAADTITGALDEFLAAT